MSTSDARQPPRFVPTLTDVVAEQIATNQSEKDLLPELSTVPVLPLASAIVEEADSIQPLAAVTSSAPSIASVETDWSVIASEIQARVLQRLDVGLEEQLRYALADTVQLHTQSMYQAIRNDLQSIVTAAVHEAIAHELAQLRKAES